MSMHRRRACATMKWPPADSFLSAVLGHALRHLEEFTPQNLANITWSIATLQLPVPKCKVQPRAMVCGFRAQGTGLSDGSSEGHASLLKAPYTRVPYI